MEIEVTNEILHQIFSEYGLVRKVLIFEKGDITKCFVEMSTKDEAARVLRENDGAKVF
jgi:hypothetical protein